MNEQPQVSVELDEKLRSAKTVTQIVYLLQALSFLVGITLVVAVIVNYVKREDVEGTWLASHFRWQIRTFWFALLWCFIGGITAIILVGYLILMATAIWFVYRIVKGFLYVWDGKEMYIQ